MRIFTQLICFLFFVPLYACDNSTNSNIDFIVPEVSVSFGDPFILYYDNKYYAYGTNGEDGIEVCTSDDLKTWTKEKNLALHKSNSYADRWFWAPEVFAINGKFYMYYSADEHICVATSESPLGPFKQTEKKPMLEGEKAIDNSLFIDEDGTPYLTFVRFNDGNNIWIAELEDDLMTLKKETMKKCLNVSQSWEEVWPRVNEGNFIIKHNGVYYMTYSANSYESQMYGVGFATATSPTGTWIKYAKNPILQNPGKLTGVGHSANFIDKDGNLCIVFHAHQNKISIHPRTMHVARLVFVEEDGKEIMKVDENSIINCVIK